jgi:hypothetical protein
MTPREGNDFKPPAFTILYFAVVASLFNPTPAMANCNSCFLPRINRDRNYSLGADRQGFFADVRLEFQDWNTESVAPTALDTDHHDKDRSSEETDHSTPERHSHNRSRERYTHLTLGANVSDRLTVLAHSAFVERFELADNGMEKEEGISDTDLVGIWRFHQHSSGYVGGLLGVKVPTGDSHRRDAEGALIQPELQPGSGSVDFAIGPVFEIQCPPLIFRGNAIYFLRNGGSQDYTSGDSTSTSLFADVILRDTKTWALYLGADLNLQVLNKDERDGKSVGDSGGTLVFLGPNMTLRIDENLRMSLAVLYPVIQDRGGSHQNLGQVTTAGARWLF